MEARVWWGNKKGWRLVPPRALVRSVHGSTSPDAVADTGLHSLFLTSLHLSPVAFPCESINLHTKATFCTCSFAKYSAHASFDLPQAFVLVTYRSLCSRWLFSITPFMLQKYSWWQASLYSSIANALNRALHESEHTHKIWIVHWTHETVSGLFSKLFSL